MNYYLPEAVEINGVTYKIEHTLLEILDVLSALNDPNLNDRERLYAALFIFYPDFDRINENDLNEAAEKMMDFIACGMSAEARTPGMKLYDWEQDFNLIIGPVNKILGYEARAVNPHWWTFISAFYNIGECAFSTVVSIRQKKLKGKKLEKWEKDFCNENKELIKIKSRVSDSQKAKDDAFIEAVFARSKGEG